MKSRWRILLRKGHLYDVSHDRLVTDRNPEGRNADLPLVAALRAFSDMMRLLLTLALLPAACSPAPDKTESKPAVSAEPPAAPFPKLGWAESRFTWEGKPFTGVTTDYHKNGQLKARYHIKDGVYHGLVEEWYENGQQKTKTSYENGLHQGDNFYWNADGSLQAHKVWRDDNLVSESRPEKNP